MLNNDEVFKLACDAVEKMFRKNGKDFTFPFDLIWQFAENEADIPSTARPHQVKRLLSAGYIEKTGQMTRAASIRRAGSATPEYRFGPALLGGALKFKIVQIKLKPTKADTFPIALLLKKDWDDFGYYTTYEATLFLSLKEEIQIGDLKILIGKTPSDQKDLPITFFANHNSKICSLGQNLNYYENLMKLSSDLRSEYLFGIRDVVFDNNLKLNFQDNPGFKISLARFSSAMQALSDAPKLLQEESIFDDESQSLGPNFTFQTKLSKGTDDLTVNFNFQSISDIPSRINVIIGYNGTGKTQLLSNLAIVTSGYGYRSRKDLLQSEAGKFLDNAPNFGGVAVVSYSAFDTFEIPGQDESERNQLAQEGIFFGYAYCGLRKVFHAENNERIYGLKDHREVRSEYIHAIKKIQAQDKYDIFLKILQPIFNEASFLRIGMSRKIDSLLDDRHFSLLSTGHKIVLSIIAQLTALLEKDRRMLVIMDEPEAHLHPPLLAALLHSFRICMEEFDAYAVIATHSPVVLQETPAKYVKILRRFENSSQVASPSTETFGENIGVITQEIFNLSDETTDWHEVLKNLAETQSLESIERKFGKRLGFTARSYVMSVIEER